jgi:hypothetical protein
MYTCACACVCPCARVCACAYACACVSLQLSRISNGCDLGCPACSVRDDPPHPISAPAFVVFVYSEDSRFISCIRDQRDPEFADVFRTGLKNPDNPASA